MVLASSAALAAARRGGDPPSVPVTKSRRQTSSGFRATHVQVKRRPFAERGTGEHTENSYSPPPVRADSILKGDADGPWTWTVSERGNVLTGV